jgi:hypothetical protein
MEQLFYTQKYLSDLIEVSERPLNAGASREPVLLTSKQVERFFIAQLTLKRGWPHPFGLRPPKRQEANNDYQGPNPQRHPSEMPRLLRRTTD